MGEKAVVRTHGNDDIRAMALHARRGMGGVVGGS